MITLKTTLPAAVHTGFCQQQTACMLFGRLLLQVNYHASNEYESVPNYKVLQQGFTALSLTRVRAEWQCSTQAAPEPALQGLPYPSTAQCSALYQHCTSALHTLQACGAEAVCSLQCAGC